MDRQNPTSRVQSCMMCGYDLEGHEPFYVSEYNLMALRCPECGCTQPAGIVAQPWRYRRFKLTTMAICWAGLLLICTVGAAAGFFAVMQSTVYEAARPLDGEIQRLYSESNYQMSEFEREYSYGHIPVSWWYESGKSRAHALFNPMKHIDWAALLEWLWFLPFGPALALLLRVILYRSHPLIQFFLVASPVVCAAMIGWIYMENRISYVSVPTIYYSIDISGYITGGLTLAVGVVSVVVPYILMVRLVRGIAPLFPAMKHIFLIPNERA